MPGALQTLPFGINDRGQIAGYYLDDRRVMHGFVYDGGAVTTVDAPGAVGTTMAFDVDDRGRTVGAYGLPVRGVLTDQRGRTTTIDAPGAITETVPFGINGDGGRRRLR